MKRMTLSEPVKIPEQYREIVLQFLQEYFDDLIWELRNHFGMELEIGEMPHNDDDYLRLMVADSIEIMARAASGETRGLDRTEVYDHVQGLVEKLFGVPGVSGYTIPQEFWETAFGSMVMRAFVWSQGDELITISEAAEHAKKTIADISQMTRRGKLQTYPDMSEPNPTKRMRVLKSEIMALKKKKRGPR